MSYWIVLYEVILLNNLTLSSEKQKSSFDSECLNESVIACKWVNVLKHKILFDLHSAVMGTALLVNKSVGNL